MASQIDPSAVWAMMNAMAHMAIVQARGAAQQQPHTLGQQQQAPSSRAIAAPNLEISLGRQGWQLNLQDQQQRGGEPAAAAKELTLLKCL